MCILNCIESRSEYFNEMINVLLCYSLTTFISCEGPIRDLHFVAVIRLTSSINKHALVPPESRKLHIYSELRDIVFLCTYSLILFIISIRIHVLLVAYFVIDNQHLFHLGKNVYSHQVMFSLIYVFITIMQFTRVLTFKLYFWRG